MSQLNAFIEHLQHDAQLQARLQEANTHEALVERVLAEGQALGYDLDASEIRQRLTAYNRRDLELTDAELAVVSGGGKSMNIYCLTNVDCTVSEVCA